MILFQYVLNILIIAVGAYSMNNSFASSMIVFGTAGAALSLVEINNAMRKEP